MKIKENDNFTQEINHLNVIVAGFVTCYARLELYKYIEAMAASRGDFRVLYTDTDSLVIATDRANPNHARLPIGPFIGNLTNELEKFGKNAYIRTWIAVAPKFYTYEVVDRVTGEILKVAVKAKGVPLNIETKEKLGFESFKELVGANYRWFKNLHARQELIDENMDSVVPMSDDDNNGGAKVQTLEYRKFKTTKQREVLTSVQVKKIRCVFDKRKLLNPKYNDDDDNSDNDDGSDDSDSYDEEKRREIKIANILSVPWGYRG
jgi:hypothetical protein